MTTPGTDNSNAMMKISREIKEFEMAEQITGETVNGVLRDLENDLLRLSKIVGHLTVIGDRLEGNRPQEDASPMVDHPPHSMINDMPIANQHAAIGSYMGTGAGRG